MISYHTMTTTIYTKSYMDHLWWTMTIFTKNYMDHLCSFPAGSYFGFCGSLVLQANKFDGSNVTVIQRTYTQPFDVKIFHPLRQPKGTQDTQELKNMNSFYWDRSKWPCARFWQISLLPSDELLWRRSTAAYMERSLKTVAHAILSPNGCTCTGVGDPQKVQLRNATTTTKRQATSGLTELMLQENSGKWVYEASM